MFVIASLIVQVVSAETVNTFKFRLDNFWSDQDVLYDYNADLHIIGNRTFILWYYVYYIVISVIFLGYRGL